MFKKVILSLTTALLLAGSAFAQNHAEPCATDLHHKNQVRMFPNITTTEALLERDIEQYVKEQMFSYTKAAAKGTNATWDTFSNYYRLADTSQIRIPVVVHVIHNYGLEYISDDKIYDMIRNMNTYYNKRNRDTADVIKPFKEYIGNARMSFHLATKDPSGKPTTGITRRYSYTTFGGDEYAKFDQWSNERYLNIWIENKIGRGATSGIVAAYSNFPADGFNNPLGDGIITNYSFVNGTDLTMPHEAGHFFNLNHTWASNGLGAGQGPDCGDDAVDDTPPTIGHFGANGGNVYDTICALGYYKVYTYTSPTIKDIVRIDTITKSPLKLDTVYYVRIDTITKSPLKIDTTFKYKVIKDTVNFPDTANVQNIMDYSNVTNMFTKGQVMRMRATLRSTATSRYKLATDSNLFITGVIALDSARSLIPTPDLAPIADFSVSRNFICADNKVPSIFTNRTWRDTATVVWTFPNGTPATSTNASSLSATFTQPGWAKVELKATSNAGSNTIVRSDLVYVADTNAINADGYYQDFNAPDTSMFPIFNYYNTDHKWTIDNNYGYYDKSSIKFNNFDSRTGGTIVNQTMTPGGNFADFYTRAFDLSGAAFNNKASLTFFSAGASRVVNPTYMNDSLIISYSVDCGLTWVKLSRMDKLALANNGFIATSFAPGWMGDWKLSSVAIPAAVAKSKKIFLRFRFYSGTDGGAFTGGTPNTGYQGYPWGTGNNFYIDRINITGNAVGVDGKELAEKGMTLSPNPTSGSATVTIKGGDNSLAQVNVLDITGKVVYRTEARLSGAATQIEIPANSIAVKGMYMVQVVSNGAAQTQKLVVY